MLVFGAGFLANTVLLFIVVAGFFRAASRIWERAPSKRIARLIVLPMSVLTAVLSFTIAMIVPVSLAGVCGILNSKESLLLCALISSAVGIGVFIYAARTPAGQRYSQMNLWR